MLIRINIAGRFAIATITEEGAWGGGCVPRVSCGEGQRPHPQATRQLERSCVIETRDLAIERDHARPMDRRASPSTPLMPQYPQRTQDQTPAPPSRRQPSDARFIATARKRLGHVFPELPDRDAFYKRREALVGLRIPRRLAFVIVRFSA